MGYPWSNGQVLSASDLNTAFDGKLDAALAGFAGKNCLINGLFDVWQRGTSFTVASGAISYTADRWIVAPDSGPVTVTQSPATPAPPPSRYSLQIQGGASTGLVRLLQRIETAQLSPYVGQVTFSAQIYNNTGATFAPALALGTPNAKNNFSAVTNISTLTLQQCPVGVWTSVSATVNIASFTNITNGLEVLLRIPAGSLDSTTKYLNVTECQMEAGATATTAARSSGPIGAELAACQRYYAALSAPARMPLGSIIGLATTTSGWMGVWALPVPMRVAPSSVGLLLSGLSVTDYRTSEWGVTAGPSLQNASPQAVAISCTVVPANLTVGNTYFLIAGTSSAQTIYANAEL